MPEKVAQWRERLPPSLRSNSWREIDIVVFQGRHAAQSRRTRLRAISSRSRPRSSLQTGSGDHRGRRLGRFRCPGAPVHPLLSYPLGDGKRRRRRRSVQWPTSTRLFQTRVCPYFVHHRTRLGSMATKVEAACGGRDLDRWAGWGGHGGVVQIY